MRHARCGWLVLLVVVLAVTSFPALAQVVVATVPTGGYPSSVAVNSVTNKTYVVNYCGDDPACQSDGTVTVIDGATGSTQSVAVGDYPVFVAVNSVTNKIYAVNGCGTDLSCASAGTVSVIDGVTLATQSVAVGFSPSMLAVNSVTNKIYVVNGCGADPSCASAGTVSVIDGVTLARQTVIVDFSPSSVAVNATTNKAYVANTCGPDLTCSNPGTATVIDGVTLNTQSVSLDYSPHDVGLNPTTNKIYVDNYCGTDPSCGSAGTVTVMDGVTLSTQRVDVGFAPYDVKADAITNTIYVPNNCGSDPNCASTGTVTVINGTTLATSDVNVGAFPVQAAVNPATNKIYVVNSCGNDTTCSSSGTVTAIDGASNATVPIAVGDSPAAVSLNSSTNTVYVSNSADNTASVIGAATTLQLVNVTPCRLVDTRSGNGGPLQGGTFETFNLPQLAQANGCSDLSSAASFSLNVTLIPTQGRVGYLTIWPASQSQPYASTMNSDGRIKANAAIVSAGVSGGVSVFVTDTTNLVLDIDAYFAPASQSTLEFYPLTPCRVVDTRNPNGDLAGPFLSGNHERDFPVLESSCIPAGVSIQAYSFNVTAVPHPAGQRLGFLTVWQQGEPQPTVSTLNNLTGTIVANAAVVAAGTGGGVAVFPNDDTDLLIDIDGYFAAPGTGGLSLYPVAPCRVLDTRGSDGNGPPFMGENTVNVTGSPCALPSSAQAYVFNATVVPPGQLGFLTLWPDGEQQPTASTLNAKDGAITSNMAIVPTTNGSIDAYASDLTQLLLDISSYFAP